MGLSILQMVLPVLLTFGIGLVCKRKNVFGQEGLKGLKAVVSNVTLPVVLFNAFFTAQYSGKIALMFATVFISCVLGLLAGFALRRWMKPYGKFLPFLLTNFEGGMLGYALYGLLYAGQTQRFAMVDIGQTVCAFTVFLATLRAVGGEKPTVGSLVRNMFTNPVFIGILLGVALGALGVGQWIGTTPAGPIVNDVIRFIAAPTSTLILIIVGYELSFRRELMKPVLKTVGLRLLVMGGLLALGTVFVFSIIPFEKPLFVAMLLAYSLPAPYIIPLFADVTGHAEYLSTTLSVQTLVSILMFIAIAAYSLAA
ncbi:MAG TPA: hypothetical protein PLP25_01355 [Candidatus Limiplasma sp.]|nr:hypothetical protein [Candidatus Limiplasma sp.]HPS80491.1 hypothetical protein [Candidatus Limiplasma sp.]